MIFENDDELGYFSRPSHGGYPSNPQWGDYNGSQAACNLILPKSEQDKIVRRAIRAHEREPLHYDETS